MPIRSGGISGLNTAFNGIRNITRVPSVGLNVGGVTLRQFLENLFFPFAPAISALSSSSGSLFEVGTDNLLTLNSVITQNNETEFNGGDLMCIYPLGQSLQERTGNEAITITHQFYPQQGEGNYLYKTFRAIDQVGNNGSPTQLLSNLLTIASCYPYLYGMSENDYSSSRSGFYAEMSKIIKNAASSTEIYLNSPTILKYAYFAFPASYDSLSQIMFNNILDVIGAWSLIATANITSSGLSSNWTAQYKIYRSNEKFTSDNLPYTFLQ